MVWWTTLIYVYVCVYVCVYRYVCMYVCMYVYVCVYAYMYMYVCIIYWGELSGGKCPTQNGNWNCLGGELSYTSELHRFMLTSLVQGFTCPWFTWMGVHLTGVHLFSHFVSFDFPCWSRFCVDEKNIMQIVAFSAILSWRGHRYNGIQNMWRPSYEIVFKCNRS